MKTPELRKLIGKRIEWRHSYDRHRGTYLILSGTLEKVSGKNAMVDGDWRWIPHMIGVKVVVVETVGK